MVCISGSIVPFQCIYECIAEVGENGKSKDYLDSCIQMTWFCMENHRKT